MKYRESIPGFIKIKNTVIFFLGILFLSYALFTSLLLRYVLPDLWIWVFICFCTSIYSFSSDFYHSILKRKNNFILKIFGILINIFIVIMVLLFFIFEGAVISNMSVKTEKKLDYIIVLGAHVKKDKPGQALQSRLDTAVNYLKENPATIIIVTGGQGRNENMTEGDCSFEYLKSHGISEEQILVENTSTSTYENFLNVSNIIDISDEDDIGFITNSFHILRAKLNAQYVGFTNIYGIASDKNIPPITMPHYLMREFCAFSVEFLHGRYSK